MPDSHSIPGGNWGIYPILFKIGEFQVETYSFFLLLGILAGIFVYSYLSKREFSQNRNNPSIILAAFLGGFIGSKLPMMILNLPALLQGRMPFLLFLEAKTITGGLIGGTIAVIIVKRWLKIHEKRGNLFAPAIAIGAAIGRVGCFFAGCCYGTPTSLPWGVNFGDGINRHPAQLYESTFFLLSAVILLIWRKNLKPGIQFYYLMLAYFTFRFFQEFIREEGVIYFHLSVFQFISILAILFMIIKHYWELTHGKSK
ncbi:MAG: prolipoprotein diacylglyceryl transferase [Ignavibacteria bacterium]|nr:prolipoprotein diacylglyceryl transferase [Ignavibacteria bacterium]